MHSEGLAEFQQAVATYAGLSQEEADEFLNITINLNKAQQVSFSPRLKKDYMYVFPNILAYENVILIYVSG